MSTDYAKDLWSRARNAMRSAEALLPVSCDDAVTRAYYVAYHAASAAFASGGRQFDRRSAVRAAVHKDWVKTAIWTIDLGADFDAVWELRGLDDDGGLRHLTPEDAAAAVQAARRILQAVKTQFPQLES